LAFGSALVVAAGVGAGFAAVANASGGESTTNVSFVPLSPPFKLESNHSLATNATLSAVVIGGSTKVPTNATTVQLIVTAGGATAGTLNIYPAGNVGGGSGQSLTWTGGSTDTQTVEENVGLSNEMSFALTGATAKLTVTITGYSTQVTAGDISPADGTAGQVLTNNGTGAGWQNSQGGASFANPNGIPVNLQNGTFTTVDTLNVPAGDYYVNFNGEVDGHSASADYVYCELKAPNGTNTLPVAVELPTAGSVATISPQGLLATNGGVISVQCSDTNGTATANEVGYPILVAVQVSSVAGTTFQAPNAGGPKK
jgi:hypothetical protein